MSYQIRRKSNIDQALISSAENIYCSNFPSAKHMAGSKEIDIFGDRLLPDLDETASEVICILAEPISDPIQDLATLSIVAMKSIAILSLESCAMCLGFVAMDSIILNMMEIVKGKNPSLSDCCSMAASTKTRQLRRRVLSSNHSVVGIENKRRIPSPKYSIKKQIDAESFIIDVDWVSQSE